jgi:hypothetical protein
MRRVPDGLFDAEPRPRLEVFDIPAMWPADPPFEPDDVGAETLDSGPYGQQRWVACKVGG